MWGRNCCWLAITLRHFEHFNLISPTLICGGVQSMLGAEPWRMEKYLYLLEFVSTRQPIALNSLSCLMKPSFGLVTGLSLWSSATASMTLTDLVTIIQATNTDALRLTPCLNIDCF